jgi:hypothetical protein
MGAPPDVVQLMMTFTLDSFHSTEGRRERDGHSIPEPLYGNPASGRRKESVLFYALAVEDGDIWD